ncbi:hypothetical protein HK405_007152 [Cladochytrium tenue]|nr:hypothetical protein HK405_007152 [Cladochytrium tenue]
MKRLLAGVAVVGVATALSLVAQPASAVKFIISDSCTSQRTTIEDVLTIGQAMAEATAKHLLAPTWTADEEFLDYFGPLPDEPTPIMSNDLARSKALAIYQSVKTAGLKFQKALHSSSNPPPYHQSDILVDCQDSLVDLATGRAAVAQLNKPINGPHTLEILALSKAFFEADYIEQCRTALHELTHSNLITGDPTEDFAYLSAGKTLRQGAKLRNADNYANYGLLTYCNSPTPRRRAGALACPKKGYTGISINDQAKTDPATYWQRHHPTGSAPLAAKKKFRSSSHKGFRGRSRHHAQG